ncbi:MAG: aminopeptidase P family protein [Roseiflexaceae bacterium]|nr:aminopeptidase P family protein [Roseiflexaceae bacterium]
MRSDLDHLMGERNIDVLVIEGPDGMGSANPAFNYFVKGEHLVGLVVKKRGEPAILIHSPWEQVQAEKTGMVLVSRDRWSIREIEQDFPDPFDATVEHRRRMLADLGVSGRVGLYGTVPIGPFFALWMALAQKIPGLELVAEPQKDVISQARLTKSSDEIELMRDVGRRTCVVVQAVVDFIAAGRAEGDTVVDAHGTPITIGAVKAFMRRELAANNLEDPSGTIFAQGRDAGLPHATGDEAAQLKLGQAIVFDIFPRQAGGGYFHDMTRTFAIGHASADLQELYDTVKGSFEHVLGELEAGGPTIAFQKLTCQYFEARGHETIATKYPIEEGYIHSLGHGIGLEVHENIRFPSTIDSGDVIVPGCVFTLEPGLYYPSRNMGVRLEDTVYCRPDGSIESLTPFPMELVIPLRG